MKPFIKFRYPNVSSVLVLTVVTVVCFFLLFISEFILFKLLILILGLLIFLGQLVIVGYTTQNKTAQENSQKVIAQNEISILFNLHFTEKIICEEKNGFQYYYSEILVLEDVYSFYSLFRLRAIKSNILLRA